jgi:glycosyltransferase involved in cell wall biosynthesis
MARVSVLLCVRNGIPFLADAIESILGQTYRDLELIVVDDASTDATPALLAGLRDPRLVLVRNERNLGLTASLNVALARARGELVARQDADDRSLPTRLERQVALLDERAEVVLCATWARLVDDSGNVVPVRRRRPDPTALRALVPRSNPFVHGSILFRAEPVRALGGYRTAFRFAQDYDLYLRLLHEHELALLPEELYEFRFAVSGTSATNLRDQAAYAEVARRLYAERERTGSDTLAAGGAIEPLLDAAKPDVETPAFGRQLARYRLSAGDRPGARSALLGVLRSRPLDLHAWALLGLSFLRRRA